MDMSLFANPVAHNSLAFEDFVEVLSDRAQEIEHQVAKLKKTPGDREVLADLFRTAHNIKGDAALCKFELAVAIVHPLESLLTRLRGGEIVFSELLAESILLAIVRLELATDSLLAKKPLNNLQLPALIQGLEKMALAKTEAINECSKELIETVTGFPPILANASAKTPKSTRTTQPQPAQSSGRHATAGGDLQFFRSLALQFESRTPLFKDRTMRILRLTLETNRAAGSPVDPMQLEAAVYLHDLGMMFLPESTWIKVEPMTAEDKAALRNHPGYFAGLLRRIPGWEVAAKMIAQHHETEDGLGYPNSLKGEQICAGAKILAIVDAFEAIMLKHSHHGKNRSVLRAIAEINACSNQFAPEWIAPFNQVIRRTLEA